MHQKDSAQEIYNRLTQNGTDEEGKRLFSYIANMAKLIGSFHRLLVNSDNLMMTMAQKQVVLPKQEADSLHEDVVKALQYGEGHEELRKALEALAESDK